MAEEEIRELEPGLDAELVKRLRDPTWIEQSELVKEAADRICDLLESLITAGRRLAQMDEALREIADGGDSVDEPLMDYEMQRIARRALEHK